MHQHNHKSEFHLANWYSFIKAYSELQIPVPGLFDSGKFVLCLRGSGVQSFNYSTTGRIIYNKNVDESVILWLRTERRSEMLKNLSPRWNWVGRQFRFKTPLPTVEISLWGKKINKRLRQGISIFIADINIYIPDLYLLCCSVFILKGL